MDGTNKAESGFEQLEKTCSSSSYSMDTAHGLIMASCERISVNGNVSAGLVRSQGHVDMQLARENNAICRQFGLDVQHPDVPLLGDDTGARFMCDYFERETKRQKGTPVDKPEKFVAPGIEPYLQPWIHTFDEPAPMSDADFAAMFGPTSNLAEFNEMKSLVVQGGKAKRMPHLCEYNGPCCKLAKNGCPSQKHPYPRKHVKHGHVSGCKKGMLLKMKK
jgi:hypothetical protein